MILVFILQKEEIFSWSSSLNFQGSRINTFNISPIRSGSYYIFVFSENQDNADPESGNLEATVPVRLTEDDIGVTLDYEFPPDSFYCANASNEADATSHASRERRTHRHRSHLRQCHRSNRRRRENESVVHFYSRHWLGQCVGAFLTGIIFLSIGIVFVTTEYSSDYVGIMFMLVSLPSFFMTIHM